MSWTKEVWRESVALALFEIGNINYQKQLWNGKIEGFQSDFDESICAFGDCGIPDYLDDFLKDKFISKEELAQLSCLNDIIDEIDEIDEYNCSEYEKLWQSSEWNNIASKAKYVFLTFFKNDFPTKRNDFVQKWPLE